MEKSENPNDLGVLFYAVDDDEWRTRDVALIESATRNWHARPGKARHACAQKELDTGEGLFGDSFTVPLDMP
jgi:hypothetical protein